MRVGKTLKVGMLVVTFGASACSQRQERLPDAVPIPLPSQEAAGLDVRRIEAVADSLVGIHLADGLMPGVSVAVMHRGALIFERGYGLADVETPTSATPQTVYRIASVTKQFTAALVMRLAEAGRLTLEDPLAIHLPGYPDHATKVAVRHLLNHTSGIRDYAELGTEYWLREFRLDLSEAEMLALFAEHPLEFEPGARHRYSNSGYYILGLVAERVAGAPYGEVLERELLDPLGLTNTQYCDNREIVPNRAEGYANERDGTLVNAIYVSTQVYGAAGALCSTAGELARWTELLHGGKVVSSDALERMTSPTVLTNGDTVTYGYGLDLVDFHGHRKIAHGGDMTGFTAYVTHYPDAALTIAVLANSENARPGAIEVALATAALEIDPAIVDIPLSEVEAERYRGRYAVGSGDGALPVEVLVENRQMQVRIGRGRPQRYRFQGDHVFVPYYNDEIRLVFHLEGERAVSVTHHQRGRAVEARRVD